MRTSIPMEIVSAWAAAMLQRPQPHPTSRTIWPDARGKRVSRDRVLFQLAPCPRVQFHICVHKPIVDEGVNGAFVVRVAPDGFHISRDGFALRRR